MNNIPLYKPYFGSEEIEAVKKAIQSGKLSRGKNVKKFEVLFSKYINKKFCVATSSGTAALHLAVKSLNLKEGDEIITTPYSFIASSNALLYEKIKPVFVDIDLETFNIDANQIENKITKKTKAILAVDIFGYPANAKKIKEISKKYNLPIIEDACEAVGKPSKKFNAGYGDIVIYGFFENKQMTSGGEGGMISTNNKIVAEYCSSARDQGRSNDKNWLDHVILGHNYRMTEMQAAFGIAQLKKIDKLLSKREKIANIYNSFLSKQDKISIPYSSENTQRSWFNYFITFKDEKDLEKVSESLSNQLVTCHKYFPPIYLFPPYRQLGHRKGSFPNCEKISDTTLSLPFYIGLRKNQIRKISKIIISDLNK